MISLHLTQLHETVDYSILRRVSSERRINLDQCLSKLVHSKFMASQVLRDVVSSTIKPFKKTEHLATFAPSALDVTFLDSYTPAVFFYKPGKGHSDNSSRLVDKLKESLSKVLVPYYPFAGRWVRTYDLRVRELQCYDQGVPFIEASIEEDLESVMNFNDYVAIESLGGFRLLGLDPTVWNQDVDAHLPALFVQVTTFKCGGVALHVSLSHMSADGEANFAFLQAWSQIALHGEISFVPTHDRSSIISLGAFLASLGQAPSEAVDTDGHAPGAVETKKIEIVDGVVGTKTDPGAPIRIPIQEANSQSSKTLHVKREVIESIKRKAAENNVVVTTVDVISGHLLRSLTNISEFVDKKTSACVTSWVEGRKKWHSPPLSEHYSGNVIALAYTPLPATAHSHLLAAAQIVHDAVRAVTSSNWQSYLAHLFQVVQTFDQLDYRQIMISSWFRFPLYEIDFGCGFGKPIYATNNHLNRFLPLGLAVILPPPPALSKDIIATLQLVLQESNGAVKALLSDQEFLSLFH